MALPEYKWAKDELLRDMDISIEKAMEARMTDLVGALLRINASAHDWCDQSDCGPCPLAVMRCQSDMDERVDELIHAFHKKAIETKSKPIKRAGKEKRLNKEEGQQPASY